MMFRLMTNYDTFTFTVSSITKGEQMVHVLNSVNTSCAVYGNHEFGKTCKRIYSYIVLQHSLTTFSLIVYFQN